MASDSSDLRRSSSGISRIVKVPNFGALWWLDSPYLWLLRSRVRTGKGPSWPLFDRYDISEFEKSVDKQAKKYYGRGECKACGATLLKLAQICKTDVANAYKADASAFHATLEINDFGQGALGCW